MNVVETKPLTQATLFETFTPVERFLREVQACDGAAPAPPVQLRAEDAYLLHLLASLYPGLHAVLDLAAPATWGATAALWASQPRGPHVFIPAADVETEKLGWQTVLRE